MQRLNVNTKGNVLIVTILVSMVLMIALMGITTSLTVGNRQAAGNQGLAERAQFAAESGLARGVANLTLIENDLKRANLNLSSGINNQAQLDAAMATLRAQMYSFCYGGPLNQTIPSSFNIQPTGVPAEGQNICTGTIAPVNMSDSDETVGNTRMALIKDNIPLTAYDPSSRFANDAAEATYWGQVAKGTFNPPIVLSTAPNGLSDRVRLSLDLSPRNIRIRQDGGYDIILGDPSRGLISVGEVMNGTTVLATRTITQALATNPATIAMSAPSFASFAWFYNTHRQSINPADAAYNQATLITSSLRVNGPAFTNGRFVFASGAAPTFSSQFGSAGCENGVPSGGSCASKAQQYHVSGIGTGTSRAVSSSAQWSGLSNIAPSFAIKRNSLGRELCSATVGGAEYECTASDPDSRKVRDVNWDRSPITMPDTAISNFQTRASSGGITVNSTDFSAPWTAGGRYFSSYTNICVTSTNSSCMPLPQSAIDGIGRFEGRPTVDLSIDPTTGLQRISISANAVRGYNLAISPDCGGSGGGGGGGGGGVGGADAPQLKKFWTRVAPKVGEFFQALGSALTFGSTALAQNTTYSSTWRCTWGSRNGNTPNGWWAYWTQDDGDSNKVVIDRSTGRPTNTTTGANATGATRYYNNNTNENLTIVYEVDTAGRIRMVSNNTGSVTSTQTILPDRTTANTLTVRTHPALATAQSTSVSSTFGSSTFNGVLFRNGNFHLEGGSGADIASYQQLTVASNNSIYLNDDITYQSNPMPTSGTPPQNLLGIYAKNDIMLTDWNRGSASTAGRSVDAVMMAETGSIRAGGFDWEGNNGRDVTSCNFATKGNFTVRGSLIQNTLGATNCVNNGTVTGGYVGNYTYDNRMLSGFAPPAFPSFSQGNWGFNATVVTPTQRGFWQVVPPQN
ncbi:MAG: pilus assembly PilX N-terminal domain-containing protein [Meiothermus sp.]|nr:pilus assembly PilX N-terminal domain-containing protein [Meiothermus sp.]